MSERKYRIKDSVTRQVYADNMPIYVATLLIDAWAEKWRAEELALIIEECPRAEEDEEE